MAAGPDLFAVFPPPAALPVSPGFRTTGHWHPGELRTVRDGEVAVLGRCLATDQELSSAPLADWPGSYTVVVLTPAGLTARVDLAGQYPLYHRTTAGRTVLAARAATVADLTGLPRRPDPHVLAARIFCPDVPELTGARSVLSGVDTLGPGQTLQVTHDGVTSFAAAGSPPATDAAAALRVALDDAVRARLTASHRVTADLSGGLDSTTVAFLAARHHTRPLPVFTYHHPDLPADDLAHARRFAALDQRLAHRIVTGTRETLPYQDLPPAGDAPDPSLPGSARTRLRLAAAASEGSDLHLTGEGADALLTAPPVYLADLARHGEHRTLVRHAYAHARPRTVRPSAVVARAVRVAHTSPTRALAHLATQLSHPDGQPLTWLRDGVAWWPGPGAEAAWLTPALRHDLAALCRATTIPPDVDAADLATTRELHRAGTVARQLVDTAREYGIWPQAPFLDHHVIRACLSVPARRRASPPAPKPLLAKAMAGLVPAEVLTRTSKGNYLAEDHAGLSANRHTVTDLLADSHLAALGVIEPARVLRSLHTADQRGLAFAALNRLLGAELWLRADERVHTC